MSGQYRRRPPYRRRDRLGFAATMWLIVLGAMIGAAVMLSVPAHSDPGFFDDQAVAYVAEHPTKVCSALTVSPTADGVQMVALDILTHSRLTVGQVGQVVSLSVRALCPQNWHAIELFTGVTLPMPPLELPKRVIA